jgi:hypothetical protein
LLGYTTTAAFIAELEPQRAGLVPPVASGGSSATTTGRSSIADDGAIALEAIQALIHTVVM